VSLLDAQGAPHKYRLVREQAKTARVRFRLLEV